MDAVRFGVMKKKPFVNLAWQMYIDAAKAGGNEFVTAGSPSASGSTADAVAAASRGSLRTAIVACHPAMEALQQAAEEFVECVVRHRVMAGEMPVEVACPNHHRAWDTHGSEPGQLS